MNIPNKLSVLRICMIPLFVVSYFLPFSWGAIVAVGIFILATFTDFLDGYIARKYNMVTDLGKLLDPIADKILVTSALFCVVATNPLQYFFNSFMVMPKVVCHVFSPIFLACCSALILARKLLISAVRMIASSKGKVIQANIFGKIKTVLQDVSLPLLVVLYAFRNLNYMKATETVKALKNLYGVLWFIAVIVFGLATIMTVVSGIIYLVQNKSVFVEEKKSAEQ